jgi:hypothetical protein
MLSGGNLALKEFFKDYSIADQEIAYKYNTKAAEFYREMLKAKADRVEFSKIKPGLQIGIEMMEIIEEFEKTSKNRTKMLKLKNFSIWL